MIRPLIALTVSVAIAGGTWIAVGNRSDEAQRTSTEIQKQSLEYQRDMQKAAQDAQDGTRSVEDVAAEADARGKELARDTIDAVAADSNVPDAAKAELEAAKAQLEQE